MMTTETETELFNQYLPALWKVAHRQHHVYGPDRHQALQEAFQEASFGFVLAARHWDPSHESGATFSTLLHTCLRHHMMKRKALCTGIIDAVPLADDYAPEDPSFPDQERRALLCARLCELSPPAQEMSRMAMEDRDPSLKSLARKMRDKGHSWKIIQAALTEIKDLLGGL